MTRRWRVKAAERPARRRANPPSPLNIQSKDWMFFAVRQRGSARRQEGNKKLVIKIENNKNLVYNSKYSTYVRLSQVV